jgi:membrane protease YdiL (CAAX protease family)
MSRAIIIVASTVALAVTAMLLQLMMGWLGIAPMIFNAAMFSAMALSLAREGVIRDWRPPSAFNFRSAVVVISLLFCTLASNAGLQFAQTKLFGLTHDRELSTEEYEKDHGRIEEVAGVRLSDDHVESLTLARGVVRTLFTVVSEEVYSRWVILGVLVLALPTGWAIVVSSLIFALGHLVYPIALSNPSFGLIRLLPTFAMGVFCGIAYLRYGLLASIFIHFATNLIPMFAGGKLDAAVDWILWGSAFVTFFVLPPTLWFTRADAPRK